MYLIERFKDEFEYAAKFTALTGLLSLIIWVLIGGERDFGFVHILVVRMGLTTLFMMLIICTILSLFALCDIFKIIRKE